MNVVYVRMRRKSKTTDFYDFVNDFVGDFGPILNDFPLRFALDVHIFFKVICDITFQFQVLVFSPGMVAACRA